MLWPTPVALVACQGRDGPANLLTIAWTGIVCTKPPMLSIAVTPARHSFRLLQETGEFTVNLPTTTLVRAVDHCGVRSGRDEDKWQRVGLTPLPALEVGAPLVAECPVNLECRVDRTLELGSHVLFVAEILRVHVDPRLVDARGRLALERAGLLAFCHGHYYALGRQLGHFGFSVRRHPSRHPDRHPDRHTGSHPDRHPDRHTNRQPDPHPARHPRPPKGHP
ncbi:MAG: flavin reductase family protein [Candidatus Riflebacteria bacterium]|nr:flavin reductase family protein [Candidatus Riflebacteria bacterium]